MSETVQSPAELQAYVLKKAYEHGNLYYDLGKDQKLFIQDIPDDKLKEGFKLLSTSTKCDPVTLAWIDILHAEITKRKI